MAKSATDLVHDIINAAVVDAIVALKDASKGLPNALLREVNAIHANTAFGDLPEPVRAAVAASVRAAFSTLQKDGYVIAEAKSVQAAPARQEHRPSSHLPSGGPRRIAERRLSSNVVAATTHKQSDRVDPIPVIQRARRGSLNRPFIQLWTVLPFWPWTKPKLWPQLLRSDHSSQ